MESPEIEMIFQTCPELGNEAWSFTLITVCRCMEGYLNLVETVLFN